MFQGAGPHTPVEWSGFVHNNKYKIQSVLDGNVLCVHHGKIENQNKLTTWQTGLGKGIGEDWIVNQESAGFRIGNVYSTSPLRVVDMNLGDGKFGAQLYDFNAKLHQQWYTHLLSNSIYMIKNKFNDKALRNNGKAQDASCVNSDHNDVAQQWRLLPV